MLKKLRVSLILGTFAIQVQLLMMTEEILLQIVASVTKTNEEQGRQIAELTAELKRCRSRQPGSSVRFSGAGARKTSPQTLTRTFDAAELDVLTDPCGASGTEEETSTGEESVSYTRGKGHKGTAVTRWTWEKLPVLETRTIEPEGVDLTGYRRIREETTYLVD